MNASDSHPSASNKSTPCAPPASCNAVDSENRSHASSTAAWRHVSRSSLFSCIPTPDPCSEVLSVQQDCAFPFTNSPPRSSMPTLDLSDTTRSGQCGRNFSQSTSVPRSNTQTPDPSSEVLRAQQDCAFPLTKSPLRSCMPTPDLSGKTLSVAREHKNPSANSPAYSDIQTPDPSGDSPSVQEECAFPLGKLSARCLQKPDPCDEPLTAKSECESPADKVPACHIRAPDPCCDPLTTRSECELPVSDATPYRYIPTPDVFGDALSAMHGCEFPLPRSPAFVDTSVPEQKRPAPLKKTTGKKKARPRVKRMEFDRCRYREVLTIPLLHFTLQEAKGRLLGVEGANIKWITSQAPSAMVVVVDSRDGFLHVKVSARYFEAFKHARQETISLLHLLFPNANIAVTPFGQQSLASMASFHLDSMLGAEYSSTLSHCSSTSFRYVPPLTWALAASTGTIPEDIIGVSYERDGTSTGHTNSIYAGDVHGHAAAARIFYNPLAVSEEATRGLCAPLGMSFSPVVMGNRSAEYAYSPQMSFGVTSAGVSVHPWSLPSSYASLQDAGGGASMATLTRDASRRSSLALQEIAEVESAESHIDSSVEQKVQPNELLTRLQPGELALADGKATGAGSSEVLDIGQSSVNHARELEETLDDVESPKLDPEIGNRGMSYDVMND